jgi:uncharacterized protein YdhG (YjbR/CyaY superfamily)
MPARTAIPSKRALAKRKARAKTVDEYLAAVPEPARSTLKEIRATIRSVVPPQATESISYGIPVLKHEGVVVWFAAFTDHCSLFPGASVIAAFKDDLKDYQTSKGTIRFAVDKPPPAALVKKLVKARMAEHKQKR